VTAPEVVVWTDGGARGNPGPAGYGAVVATPGGQVLAEVAEGIGWATNNVAEYRGVIAGLRRAKELGARRVRVRADSLLVVAKASAAGSRTARINCRSGTRAIRTTRPKTTTMKMSSAR